MKIKGTRNRLNDENFFLHFTNWEKGKVHIDDVYTTLNWGKSNYWEGKLKGDDINHGEALLSRLNIIQLDGKKIGDLFAPFSKQLSYSSELLKEYIFEEVRSEKYPSQPSRQTCMFLFARKCDPKAYAKKIGFDVEKYNLCNIYPIKEECKLHFGDYRLLDCNMEKYKVIAEKATEYWEGCRQISITTEILLEGNFKIVPRSISV